MKLVSKSMIQKALSYKTYLSSGLQSPLKILPGTSGPISTKLGMTWKHCRLRPIIFCSNDKPGLTLNYFMARSNFATYAFTWENVTVMDSLEIIASCGLEFGLYYKLND